MSDYGTCRHCSEPAIGVYLTGPGCVDHTAAAIHGHPPVPVPDPEFTLDGLRRKAGIRFQFRTTDTALYDEVAIATGRRRSSPQQYRDARAAQEARKKKR